MGCVLDGGSATLAGVVGREAELAVLSDFAGVGARNRALVLAGEAGIGKTTLWEAGIELARDRGLRVLLARPSGAEARLSFAALIDLFEGVDVGALAGVPAPQRAALEVALLRAEPTRVPREPHAIALGVLNALRALAVEEPLVVAVDDFPWLDAPSADALVFAVRRLQGAPVGLLLARRPGRASAIERALEPWGPQRVEVGRLSFSASRRLLADRLGLVLSRQVLRRIVASTLGNPLFILEVGRALRERGVPRAGDDIPVPDGVEELLGTRVSRLAPEVRRLLLAVALSAELRADELAAVVGAEVVEEAADAGLLLDRRWARARSAPAARSGGEETLAASRAPRAPSDSRGDRGRRDAAHASPRPRAPGSRRPPRRRGRCRRRKCVRARRANRGG